MNFVHTYFLCGNYSEAIIALEKMYLADKSVCFQMAHKINKLLCQCLVNEAILDEEMFLSIYDNCVLSLIKNPSNRLRHIRISVLYNCVWLLLTRMNNNKNRELIFNKLLNRYAVLCSSVESQASQDELPDLRNTLSRALKTIKMLAATNSDELLIFLELTILIILAILYYDKSSPLTFVKNFLKSCLDDSLKMISMLPKHCTELEPECDVLMIDLRGFPVLSNYRRDDCEEIVKAFILTLNIVSITLDEYYCLPAHKVFIDSHWETLVLYTEAFKLFKTGEEKKSYPLLLQAVSKPTSPLLQSRVHCLQARIYSKLQERHNSIDHFVKAIDIDQHYSVAYYYLGQEFCKLGLHKPMLKNYQNLLKSSRKKSHSLAMKTNEIIETRLLHLLHASQDISKTSALYVLAVAYGVNEMFDEASIIFEELMSEKCLSALMEESSDTLLTEKIVPNVITIMHEAATMFLKTGNFTSAEVIAHKAIQAYPSRRQQMNDTQLHGTRDAEFIANILRNEYELVIAESIQNTAYYENYLSIFHEDIIGLLILADVQHVSENFDTARLTLNQALLLLSKFITQSQNQASAEQLALVNALTCKTCLRLAIIQSNTRSFPDVSKMYKRALSCNNSDKDALYHYACYLVSNNKTNEAEKLWHTFIDKVQVIVPEKTQSLSLRYLLRTETSPRQMSLLLMKLGIKNSL